MRKGCAVRTGLAGGEGDPNCGSKKKYRHEARTGLGWRGGWPGPREESDAGSFPYIEYELACEVVAIHEDEVALARLDFDLY